MAFKHCGLGIILCMFSCNHLFYQPDHIIRSSWSHMHPTAFKEIVKNNDGLNITLLRFPASPPQAKGIILHFHGNAENMTTHFAYVSWLCDYGFEVVTFDYRGYGESEGKPDRQGLIVDGKAILERVRVIAQDNGGIPIFVVAQSLGGAIAIPVLAQENVASVKALILDSSFSSYRGLAQEKLASFFLTWPLQLPLSFLISEEESPNKYLPQLKMPILIIHSRFDPVVPYEEGRALSELSRYGTSEMWTIEDNYQHTAAFLQGSPYREKLVAWIESHLK